MVLCEPTASEIISSPAVQAGAAAAAASGMDVLGSILFCLSMNHKQMAVYYAPAFFAHLLGKCLQKRTLSSKVWFCHSMQQQLSPCGASTLRCSRS